MTYKGYVKVPNFALQVAAFRAKREQEREDLKNEVNNFSGVRMNMHPGKNNDAYFARIRTAVQKPTPREIKGKKEEKQQHVRPLFLKH